MSNLNKLDFAPLETTGAGYYKRVSDVRQHLKVEGILNTMLEPSQNVLTIEQAAAFEANQAKAIILMTRHMNDLLQNEYFNEEDPRKLWVEVEERFDNIHDSLLPYLEVRWNNLRFSDFKSVLDYNSKTLLIKSQMEFYGKNITDTILIEKTLSTFLVSALMIAKNYQINLNSGRITSCAPKGGRKELNFKTRDDSGCSSLYSRPKEEGNYQDRRAWNCGGQCMRIEGGRASGYGGGTTKENRCPQRAPRAPLSREPEHKDVCLRHGLFGHWVKACKAS
ncbi:uncharacterized protein LOC121050696 [Rosa chinensis]|uniref:uncharacterized protein LOC121050696 n=1 Tax=Rosa chinensis TaxID=74649 RepID=UPI001AD938E8|nr:uncharacterized protein LOC121050696 [Rosa chinensis]